MQVLGLVVTVVAVLVIGLALGVVLLRAACNRVGVPVPGFGRAAGVVFVAALVTGLINFGVRVVVTMALSGGAWNPPPEQAFATAVVADAMLIPIDWLIIAGLYSWLLKDVTYGQGFLIYFAQIVIVVVIGLILAGIALVIYAVLQVMSEGS
jgi:hypothetical protein